MRRDSSFCAKSLRYNIFINGASYYIYNGVILRAYPVRGESHNQRNTTGEVATVSFKLDYSNAETCLLKFWAFHCHIK